MSLLSIILIGPPETGKSTILNHLLGRRIFESGITPLGQLTDRVTEIKMSNEISLVDVPGLAVDKDEEKIAAMIDHLFDRTSITRIYFTATLTERRVSHSALSSMIGFMKSVNKSANNFGVIFNKIPEQLLTDEYKSELECQVLEHLKEEKINKRIEKFHFISDSIHLHNRNNEFDVRIRNEVKEILTSTSISENVRTTLRMNFKRDQMIQIFHRIRNRSDSIIRLANYMNLETSYEEVIRVDKKVVIRMNKLVKWKFDGCTKYHTSKCHIYKRMMASGKSKTKGDRIKVKDQCYYCCRK
jgi:GTP-binding protein EngB required for normal cell division